ncbi:MAG: DUF1697 domain-containing protein [Phycisphaerales bacterium]|nr:DUF1697 domain-containing protein [Phycisphaerales bacterium]
MASVVFLRGVNVGGRKTFKPAELCRALNEWDVVNIGAAGTFVVRASIAAAALKAEILRRLPFDPEVMICPGREIVRLVGDNPFEKLKAGDDAKPFVTVLAKRPRTSRDLPVRQPDNDDWQVHVVAVTGRYALSLHRRQTGTLIYPNEVVEKHFHTPATTRSWNTMEAVCKLLT